MDTKETMRRDKAASEAVQRRETVNHPSHYGGDTVYEHIKVARAWGLVTNAFLYNCTKYLCRSGGAYQGRKNGAAPLEDLRKARWYLDRAIEDAEREERETKLRAEATCEELECEDPIGEHSPFCHLYTGPKKVETDESDAPLAPLVYHTCLALGCDLISRPNVHNPRCRLAKPTEKIDVVWPTKAELSSSTPAPAPDNEQAGQLALEEGISLPTAPAPEAGRCTACGGPVMPRAGKPGEFDHECAKPAPAAPVQIAQLVCCLEHRAPVDSFIGRACLGKTDDARS